MDRSTAIRDRLVGHCRKLSILCSEIPASDWPALPLALEYRYGWMPPIDLEALQVEDNLIAIISPELLARTTAHLDDVELQTYLMVLELIIDLYVQHQGTAVEEIAELVDNTLWDQAPDALRLRLEVEAHAMDEGIVTVHH